LPDFPICEPEEELRSPPELPEPPILPESLSPGSCVAPGGGPFVADLKMDILVGLSPHEYEKKVVVSRSPVSAGINTWVTHAVGLCRAISNSAVAIFSPTESDVPLQSILHVAYELIRLVVAAVCE